MIIYSNLNYSQFFLNCKVYLMRNSFMLSCLYIILTTFLALCAYAEEPEIKDAPRTFGHYFIEYQVIQVPNQVIRTLCTPKNKDEAVPTIDEVIPKIYQDGKYRTVSSVSGYVSTDSPSVFRMIRQEYYPVDYILPNPEPREEEKLVPGKTVSVSSGEDEDKMKVDSDSNENQDSDEDTEDGEHGEDDAEDDDEEDDDENSSGYNNLLGPFPLLSDEPLPQGNDFMVNVIRNRELHIPEINSIVRKSTGNSYADYGDWGRAPFPIWENNSMNTSFHAVEGKIIVIASKNATSTYTTLHVFFLKELPLSVTAIRGNNTSVPLEISFNTAYISCKDYESIVTQNGMPCLPPEEICEKMQKAKSFQLLSNNTYRALSGKNSNSKDDMTSQSYQTNYFPGTAPGEPAKSMALKTLEFGTNVSIFPQLMADEKTVKLNFRFIKTSNRGWRNFSYKYLFDSQEDNNHFSNEQTIVISPASKHERTGSIRSPLIEENELSMTTYLPLDKNVMLSKISNPSFQSDIFFICFVKVSRVADKKETQQTK